MVDVDARRRAGRALAGLLALDGLAHLYWATGATWPAADERALSRAVIGRVVPFAPHVVLPLALVLFTAAAAVLARGYGRGGRIAHLVACGVAVGLTVRGIAGVAWATGLLDGAGTAFFWLNLLLYTPLCLGFGALAAARLAARDGRSKGRAPAYRPDRAGARVEEFPRDH